jgi:uroporphyrinogen decarboxylase
VISPKQAIVGQPSAGAFGELDLSLHHPARTLMSSSNKQFDGLHVASFESRRAMEMDRMIGRLGGIAHVSPSMAEVSLEDQREAIEFAKQLMTGQIDIVILMTGVGTGHLVDAVEAHLDRQRFLNALSDAVTVVRGPKPLAALRKLGIEPTYRAAEPNTWREVLQILDEHVRLAHHKVAVQEYGKGNPSFVAGLEARGAEVLPVPVYRWELPPDTGPLEANVRALVAGEIDVALFTSAQQLVNLQQLARGLKLEEPLAAALKRVVIGSIGPTTSEALREQGLAADLVPRHPKMGHLVSEAAARSGDILRRKERVFSRLQGTGSERPRKETAEQEKPPWSESPFMKACRREPCTTVPIWLMRQAGRYMEEYREVRSKTTFLELCKDPALCAEVMITAVNRLGVDAAIIFSDLLPMLEPMGFELEFAQGEGPVIHNPIRSAADVDSVIELESVDALDFVMETVRLTRAGLPAAMPLIGFAGAPFTLASYAIEGGSSRNYLHTKTLMYRDPGAFRALMQRLSRSIAQYLNAQIAAGAQAVQLFDSWAGCLSPADYRQHVLEHTKWILDHLAPGVPAINFATGNPALLPLLSEAGGAVIGVDWRISLGDAWQTIGYDKGVQGNLDPLVLLADRAEIRRHAKAILEQACGRPGHIFNLGHGVLPQTPVDNVVALVEMVHELGPQTG